jgi:hypothetical protein
MNWPKISIAKTCFLALFFWSPSAHAKEAIGATFKIERVQATSCERNRRFNEFLFLAATLSDQITDVSITFNPKFATCMERVAQSLRRINLTVKTSAAPDQRDAVIVSINLGGDAPKVIETAPEVLPEEKKSPDNIAKQESPPAKNESSDAADPSLSLPIIVKLAAGYTLLTPLPDEQVRDRPTVEATIRTQPIIPDYFFMGNTSVSLKSGSKLPWAVIASGMVATDLFYLRENISIPLGLGMRGFKAKVNKQKSSPLQPTAKNIVIPEQVLGPIAQIGIAYRSGLVTADAQVAVTPIMAAGSPLITTYNASLMLGYQITPVDSIIINTLRHDLRYPTIDSYVKVIVASITLGYQKDLL